jgi:RsiW-degrading membrane proteinase PrsW (M82 family)
MSLLGDGVVPASLWLSWAHPYVFFAALAVMVLVMILVIWMLARFVRQVFRRFSGSKPSLRPN